MQSEFLILLLLITPVMQQTIDVSQTQEITRGTYWIPELPVKFQQNFSAFTALPGGIVTVYSNDFELIQWMQQHTYYKLYTEQLQLTTKEHPSIITTEYTVAQQINVSVLWNAGITGNGIVTAVIDSGIDFNHPALQGKEIASQSFISIENGYNNNEDAKDYLGHGTAVASLIAGTGAGSSENIYRGMANESKLVNAKVANSEGEITILGLLHAIDWVSSLTYVDCINLSLGGLDESPNIEPFEAAVNIAIAKGKYVFASAGNLGLADQIDPFSVKSPGSSPDVITVGAVDSNNIIPSFSSEGPTQQLAMKPEILAPGVNIMVAKLYHSFSNYTSVSGTSFSAPITTGVGILLLADAKSRGITLTSGALKILLLQSAELLSTTEERGNHLLNAGSAWHLLQTEEYKSTWISQPLPNYINYIPKGSSLSFGVSIFSASHRNWQFNPIDTPTVHISGDLIYNGTYATVFRLTVNNLAGEQGNFSSYLQFQGVDVLTTYFQIQLTQAARLRVLVDLRHTSYDMLTGYSRIYSQEMLDIQSTDVWLEENFVTLSSDILKRYDVIWFTDLGTQFVDDDFVSTQSEVLLQADELYALQLFQQSGGKFLVDFSGSSNRDTFAKQRLYVQKDIQSILSLFDMSVKKIDSTLQLATTVKGLVFSKNTDIYMGSTEIVGGIPIITSAKGISYANAYLGENNSKAIVINTRNWRDTSIATEIWRFLYAPTPFNLSSNNTPYEWTITLRGNISYAYLLADGLYVDSSIDTNIFTFQLTSKSMYFNTMAILYVETSDYNITMYLPVMRQSLQITQIDSTYNCTLSSNILLLPENLQIYLEGNSLQVIIKATETSFAFQVTGKGNLTIFYRINGFLSFFASVLLVTTQSSTTQSTIFPIFSFIIASVILKMYNYKKHI